MNKYKVGKYFEAKAVNYLKSQGYFIKAQNWRCGKMGELDIVAIDPERFGKSYLVIVEVKFRRTNIGFAMSAVDYKKQEQIKKLSKIFLKSKGIVESKTNISYDVIALSFNEAKKLEIEHLKNIF